LIERQDRWFIFRGNGHYDVAEIGQAMEESETAFLNNFTALLPKQARDYLVAYILSNPILYTLFQNVGVREAYYLAATNKELPFDDLLKALDVLKYAADTIYPNTSYEPREFYIEEELFGPASLSTAAVEVFQQVEFNAALKPKLESHRDDPEYLKAALQQLNARLRQAAAERLGELHQGEADLLRLVKEERKDFQVLAAALEALAKFNNEPAEKVLIKQITKGSFLAHLEAGGALVARFPIARAIKILTDFTRRADSFVRGEGASLLKYLYRRDDAADSRELIKQLLLTLAFSDSEPLVRALAIESLGYTKDPALLPALAELKNFPDLTVNIMAAKAEQLINSPLVWELSAHRYEHLTFYTQFFKYPRQLEWITGAVREQVQQQNGAVNILDVGSSFGLEPLSVLMHLVEDYDASPKSWLKRDPRTWTKIMVTDIDLEALLYARRGRFVLTDLPATNEFLGLQRYARLQQLEAGTLAGKYFTHSFWWELFTGDYSYTLKPKYRSMLTFSYFNVVNPANPLPADPYISIINNVDMYLSLNHRNAAAYNLCQQSGQYVTGFVTYMRAEFLRFYMQKKEENGKHMFLFEKHGVCKPTFDRQ
jgi:chemotaxis methyl-accepting protein methylase